MERDFIRQGLIHSGKANNVYATNYPDYLELESSDRILAGNDAKRDIILGKGVLNNKISSTIFKYLEENGIPTHFVCEGSNEASKIVRAAQMIPLEVICRLYAAGSFSKRYGLEGKKFSEPLIEYTYKSDLYGDPIIDRKTILAIPEKTLIKNERELNLIDYYTARTGLLLSKFYYELGIKLVDFKVEYGRISSDQIVLCDEISPDTCRLIDIETGEILDKDLFRKDLGDVGKGYSKVLRRITKKEK